MNFEVSPEVVPHEFGKGPKKGSPFSCVEWLRQHINMFDPAVFNPVFGHEGLCDQIQVFLQFAGRKVFAGKALWYLLIYVSTEDAAGDHAHHAPETDGDYSAEFECRVIEDQGRSEQT